MREKAATTAALVRNLRNFQKKFKKKFPKKFNTKNEFSEKSGKNHDPLLMYKASSVCVERTNEFFRFRNLASNLILIFQLPV
jgi:hypothetical protein